MDFDVSADADHIGAADVGTGRQNPEPDRRFAGRSRARATPVNRSPSLSSSDTNDHSSLGVVIPPVQRLCSLMFQAEDGLIDSPQSADHNICNGAAPVSANVRVNDRTAPTFTSARVVATASRPEFRWNAIANATSYEITVTNLTTGQVNVIQQAGIQQNSFVSPTDLPIGNYAVRVRGFNSANLASAGVKLPHGRFAPERPFWVPEDVRQRIPLKFAGILFRGRELRYRCHS